MEGHVIATFEIRDQLQFDRNYKLPGCKQQPVGAPPPYYGDCQQTESRHIPLVSCSLFYFLPRIQLPFVPIMQRQLLFSGFPHSDSNSCLSALDVLCQTNPQNAS